MPAKTRFAEIASVTISGKGMGVAAGAEAAVGPVVAGAAGAPVSSAGRAAFSSARVKKNKQSLFFILDPTDPSFFTPPAPPPNAAQHKQTFLCNCLPSL